MKLIKKFKAHLMGESVLIKHLRNPIQNYPYMFFYKKKKIYNEDNSLANRREGSGRNPKLNEKLIEFIIGVLIKDRKETLAYAKILNDNFGVKVSEKTINRVLHAHDIE